MASSSGAGWHLTVQASQFSTIGGKTLPAGSLFMAAPGVAPASGVSGTGTSTPPTVSISGEVNALDSGAPVTVASAPVDNGMGTYNFSPVDFAAAPGKQLKLVVPAGAYAGSYSSTLTVSIVTAPAS